MTATHGRAGRRGRSWLITALAAPGLCLAAPAARPAMACHIHHDNPKATAAEAASPASPAPAEGPSQVLNDIMKGWPAKGPAEPQVISPAASPSPAPSPSPASSPSPSPAASMLQSPAHSVQPIVVAPSVANYQGHTAMPCTPPVPPCQCQAPMPIAQPQGIAPPLKAPAALLNPTPAPEPSTILSALALAGAFAWRRRARR